MILRPANQRPDRLIGAFSDLRSLDWTNVTTPPAVVAYTPLSQGNPYQSLLYSRSLDHNVLPVGLPDIDSAAGLLHQLGEAVPRMLHLHWLNVVMAKAADRPDAAAKKDAFVEKLRELRAGGVHIMWTCHNVLPHDLRFEDLEIELRRSVIEVCDAVHVMSPLTVEMCAPYFDIPTDKIVAIDHPSFADVYPSWVSRADARRQLGLSDGTLVWLLLGGLRPYKGLTELLSAVDEIAAEQPGQVALVVAGEPDRSAEVAAVLDRALTHPAVHVLARRVTDPEVQLFTAAADASVAPYRRSLNSGAVVLSLSHGLPVVLSSASGALPLVDNECAVTYDEDEPGSLVAALRESRRLANPQARAAARERAARLDAHRVAGEYAAAVRAIVDSPVPAEAHA